MEEKPIKIEIIETNKEAETTLKDAARLAMQINSDSGDDMGICIVKASEETGYEVKDIAKALATWNKKEPVIETKEEKEQRDIEFGIAERKEDGTVEYLYNE